METYELVVYTTSVMDYAEAVLEGINIKQYFSRVYDRKYCCTVSGAKDLSVVSTDFKKMILIDVSLKYWKSKLTSLFRTQQNIQATNLTIAYTFQRF